MKVVDQGAASNLPIYVADSEGFLKDEGIKLQTLNIKAGAAELIAALQSKQADVIIQTPLTLQAGVRQGVHASFFMGMGNADADLIVPAKDKSTPVASSGNWKPTIQALKGKTIGESVRGSTTGAVYEGVFRAAGVDATYTVSGPGPQSLAALRSGQVDAIVADSLATANSVAEGVGRDVMDIGAGQGPPGYGDWMQIGAIARNDALTQDQDKFEKFARAVAKGAAFMKDPRNAAAVQKVVEKQYGLKPDAA
jgi:NitT/TauT family transport system substrate-binding protein